MTEEELTLVTRVIAGQLDYPSVYMGGPSPGNIKRAKNIVGYLVESKRLVPTTCDHSTWVSYHINGTYCPNCSSLLKLDPVEKK